MRDIDWNNVVSAVATAEGLVVTEKQGDGTLGASYLAPIVTRKVSMPTVSNDYIIIRLRTVADGRTSDVSLPPMPAPLAMFVAATMGPSVGKSITAGGNTTLLADVSLLAQKG